MTASACRFRSRLPTLPPSREDSETWYGAPDTFEAVVPKPQSSGFEMCAPNAMTGAGAEDTNDTVTVDTSAPFTTVTDVSVPPFMEKCWGCEATLPFGVAEGTIGAVEVAPAG